MNSSDEIRCSLCASESISELGSVGFIPVSVTSDSKLCNVQARVYVCLKCQHIQKFHHNAGIFSVMNSVYKNYAPHYLSNGNEQLLFPDGLKPRSRTMHVFEKCMELLPKAGKLLDIGTGNGSVLKSASKLLPNWQLHAFDVVESYKEEILKIPNVVSFVCGTLDDLALVKYDLIVLWHALEHISNPTEVLMKLKNRLSGNGYLLVQVPDIQRNPFDFAVIDHYSHFTMKRLTEFLYSLGFTIVANGYEWTHNCLTLVLKKMCVNSTDITTDFHHSNSNDPRDYYCWLNKTLEYFQSFIGTSEYAIFGTGMASLWVYSQLSKKTLFFIDEDNSKSGNCIDDISIVTPGDMSLISLDVLIPFIQPIGLRISSRLQNEYHNMKSYNFILPPNL